MLLIIRQQVQPDFIIAVMQAQQASIMAEHAGSPLVQVMETPSSVASNLQRPMVRLQQQTIIPFIMQQQLHRPPVIMLQRFCNMPADTLSSHEQTTCMPPLHLVNVIVQRGTIIMFMPAGDGAWVPIIPFVVVRGMAIPERSIIMAVVIPFSLLSHQPVTKNPRWGWYPDILATSRRDFKSEDVNYRQGIMDIMIHMGMLPKARLERSLPLLKPDWAILARRTDHSMLKENIDIIRNPA
jgi:hypothetical protein